jgi:hypothetical protein
MADRREGIITELRNNLERFIVWAYEHARLHLDDIRQISGGSPQ